ncbi:MAG: hypothetical protein P1U64_07325 [Alcanivoracaceae bacterium]|nr:hypothetical protein [Alcanivoracaceae bacterium]
MSRDVLRWAAEKLESSHGISSVEITGEGFLNVTSNDGYVFLVAVIGVSGVVKRTDVSPLFEGKKQPSLVISVPSKTLWSGSAIDCVHDASAAFGRLGDVARAASTGDASSFRDKNMGFFINAIRQHSNVSRISYVYDRVFEVTQYNGKTLKVAVIDAYNMSAEDVRHARDSFGNFDIVVKSSSYGSITNQAEDAAKSMGAEALTFKALMGRLAR